MSVALVGTMDTKGEEYGYVRDCLTEIGVASLVIDVGLLGEPLLPVDVTRHDVAESAGTSVPALLATGDRANALTVMGLGARVVLRDLCAAGRCSGVLALGGSGGMAIALEALLDVPFGIPKTLVSTQTAFIAKRAVGLKDVLLIPSVGDISGLNSVTRTVLKMAAHATVGALTGGGVQHESNLPPTLFTSMIGLTTSGVTLVRETLETAGYEVVTFPATDSGGAAMEELIEPFGAIGILDLTTVEIADAVVGGTRPAEPSRFERAGALGIPQVISLGGLDMVRFGPPETVPVEFSGRLFHQHTPTVTLMRTSPQEARDIGLTLGERLAKSKGPVSILVPLGGLSELSVRGGPFRDTEADGELFASLEETVQPEIPLVRVEADINSPEFADHCVQAITRLLDLPKV